MNGKSNSQGAGNEYAGPGQMNKPQRDSGWDIVKVSSFDFTEGRRPA
jgi:hypothetical protein